VASQLEKQRCSILTRIVFMGTPDFAVPTLAALFDSGYDIAAVYTQPPRAAGRGMSLRKSAVQVFAEAANMEVRVPERLKSAEEQERFRALGVDVGVVVAYGLILPKPILDAPGHGCLNLHPSLLPDWRGAAPINRAIMAGDTETGVSIMRMDEGLDTGSVCLVERVPIEPDETAGELHDRLALLGARLMIEAIDALEQGKLTCWPQPEQGSYAEKITPAEARLNFRAPAHQLHDRIRGLSPHPGAWCEIELNGKPERIKVLRATLVEQDGAPGTVLDDNLAIACGKGAIRLIEVQRAGKRPMTAEEFLHGVPTPKGTVLT
jgi:methionyl-tRNA formyltransferase